MNTSSVRRPTYPYRFEAAVRRAAWGWLGRQIAAFVAWHQAARTARALSALSDQQLLDIGLLRGDIREAAVKSAAGC